MLRGNDMPLFLAYRALVDQRISTREKIKRRTRNEFALKKFGAPSGMEWRTVSPFAASPQVPKGMEWRKAKIYSYPLT